MYERNLEYKYFSQSLPLYTTSQQHLKPSSYVPNPSNLTSPHIHLYVNNKFPRLPFLQHTDKSVYLQILLSHDEYHSLKHYLEALPHYLYLQMFALFIIFSPSPRYMKQYSSAKATLSNVLYNIACFMDNNATLNATSVITVHYTLSSTYRHQPCHHRSSHHYR